MSLHSSDSSDFWIGQHLGSPERYRLDRRLGSGAVGAVFLAMDMRLGRRVAVKVLRGAFAQSQEVLARFEREVALSVALESEHIVEVIDYGVTSSGYPFYVMEYLQGQTLSQLLGRKGFLSTEQSIAIALQLCAGLEVAHAGVTLWKNQTKVNERVKVIHRDLKPANIFLIPTPLGELVKILDFGIAKKLHTDDQSHQTKLTQTFLGTFRYAAPEQLRSAWELDERADIYSLGMILYEMLSGTDPFGVVAQASPRIEQAWARAHTSIAPIPLRQQPNFAQVSANLEAIVMRCLCKRPDERFASVRKLGQALYIVRVEQPAAGVPSPAIAPDPTTPDPVKPDALASAAHSVQEPTVYRPVTRYTSEVEATADGTILQPIRSAEIPLSRRHRVEASAEETAENATENAIDEASVNLNQSPDQPPLEIRSSIPKNEPVKATGNDRPVDATIAQFPHQANTPSDATLYQIPQANAQPDVTRVQELSSPKRSGPRIREIVQNRANSFREHQVGDSPLAQVNAWLRSSAFNYVDRLRSQASAEVRYTAYRWLAHLLPVGIGLAFGLASLSGAYLLFRKGDGPPSRSSTPLVK